MRAAYHRRSCHFIRGATCVRSRSHLPTPSSDVVYWDAAYPGFGVKITPKGRKVFIVLYRTGGAGSYLRKYTIGPYGRVTLHQARVAVQKVFAAPRPKILRHILQ